MFRAAAAVFAGFLCAVAAVSLCARFTPVVNHPVLIVAAWSPYLTLAAAIAATALLLARRWRAAVPTLMIALTFLAIELPLFIGAGQPPEHNVAVRVLTANIYNGAADVDATAATAREQADVLVVQELTPDFAERLGDELASDFPYRAVDARPFTAGIGIWSRHPIIGSSRVAGYELGLLQARLRVPGASSEVLVVAVHLVGPWPQPIDPWRREIGTLPGTLSSLADEAAPAAVIVAGDFNATPEMRPFRKVLDAGFQDAAEQAGAGLAPTFPAVGSLPPHLGIDRILVRNGSAGEVGTVRFPGSDHLGLRATVYVAGPVN